MSEATLKRPGRPPALPGTGKEKVIRVRVTDAQYEKWEKMGGATRTRDWIDRTKLK